MESSDWPVALRCQCCIKKLFKLSINNGSRNRPVATEISLFLLSLKKLFSKWAEFEVTYEVYIRE
jgi:hypothetical protein